MVKKILWVLFFVSFLNSCKTNDVPYTPMAKLNASQLTLTENNGDSVLLELSLDDITTSSVTAFLEFQGTATQGVDYSVSSTQIIIPAGDTLASVFLQGINDEDIEGTEDITVLFQLENAVNIGQTTVSVILDDDDSQGLASLILNEILYDPYNSGLDGDANGDGIYVQNEDEFIELVNIGSTSIDLSGYKVYDATALSSNSPRHEFPNGTILPAGGVHVLFGGGTPTGSFGGAQISATTTGMMNLNNSGDVLTITNSSDSVMIQLDITPLSDNPNESYTRSPDLIGELVQHTTASTLLFSPGTKSDGSSF